MLKQIATGQRLIGDGPAEASSCLGIERQPFRWDTNGFYRLLGLTTDATRVEIARAYIELDGYKSSVMTNATRVLLDKRTRAVYDALPIGSLWRDDERLQQYIEVVRHRISDPSWWSAYVRDGLEDGATGLIDRAWWSLLANIVGATTGERFAVGVTGARDIDIGLVGQRLVIFLPLPIALVASMDYGDQIARSLVRQR